MHMGRGGAVKMQVVWGLRTVLWEAPSPLHKLQHRSTPLLSEKQCSTCNVMHTVMFPPKTNALIVITGAKSNMLQ